MKMHSFIQISTSCLSVLLKKSYQRFIYLFTGLTIKLFFQHIYSFPFFIFSVGKTTFKKLYTFWFDILQCWFLVIVLRIKIPFLFKHVSLVRFQVIYAKNSFREKNYKIKKYKMRCAWFSPIFYKHSKMTVMYR